MKATGESENAGEKPGLLDDEAFQDGEAAINTDGNDGNGIVGISASAGAWKHSNACFARCPQTRGWGSSWFSTFRPGTKA